jgi:hypothetical protein
VVHWKSTEVSEGNVASISWLNTKPSNKPAKLCLFPASFWFLVSLNFRSWRWGQDVSPKRQLTDSRALYPRMQNASHLIYLRQRLEIFSKRVNCGNMNSICLYRVDWRRGEALHWSSADFDSDLGWHTGYPEASRGVPQLIQANVETAARHNEDAFAPNSSQFNNRPYHPQHTFWILIGS